MFVWASIPSIFKDGFELSDKVLYDANVFITPGGIFGSAGSNFVRVSLCSKIDMIEKAIERIKATG
jgi:LL-diaminopimelate aminotransferase